MHRMGDEGMTFCGGFFFGLAAQKFDRVHQRRLEDMAWEIDEARGAQILV